LVIESNPDDLRGCRAVVLKRLRWKLAIAVAVLSSILAIAPLWMWRTSRVEQLELDLESYARWNMEIVYRAGSRGELADQPLDFQAWFVNGREGEEYIETLYADPLLGVPLNKWMREAEEEPAFRTFTLDGDVEYLGYVSPYRYAEGYITVVDTNYRNSEIARVKRLSLVFAGIATLVNLGLGWFVAGMALGPARKAVKDQQGFLADAAHEMRTPLAVILASSSQSLSRPRTSEEYVRSLSEIRSAAERASSGVNELLDLVRFDSGQAIPRIAPLRLDLLAEEVAASVRPEDCEVEATPGEPVIVEADMALLRQAIDNLVRNATRRCTKVEIEVSISGREGVLDVLDNGPGFDPKILPRVFDRYQRGDRRGDVGMGLAIVKAIATAHGGTVEASNREDGGARVRVRVPLSNRS
jgi:signal transduction histidine kinase